MNCNKSFSGGIPPSNEEIWKAYVYEKQTYRQLSERYGFCVKTIQRRLDKIKVENQTVITGKAVIVTDTTYFGRNFGLMVIKEVKTGKYLWRKFVTYETLNDYRDGFDSLKA